MPRALTPDELLSTTRAVRKGLNLQKPVELSLIRECLELAIQAPTGSFAQGWHFVLVTEPQTKRLLGEIYRRAWEIYAGPIQPASPGARPAESRKNVKARIRDSAVYLAEHMHEVPLLLIPCTRGRVENADSAALAGLYGSILPATWSFMLAARARGLGTCWTTLHLMFEAEAAEVLGIPYSSYTQVAMIPVAYALREDFKPGARKPLEDFLHLESW
jgi:nitroreductase